MQSQEVYVSETNDVNVTKRTNQDLRYLSIKRLEKLIIRHLNMNSLQNKFDLLTYQINDNTDIVIIMGTKLDESFPIGQVFINGFSSPFRLDRDRNGGGVSLYMREDISSKLLSVENIIQTFLMEINLHKKK